MQKGLRKLRKRLKPQLRMAQIAAVFKAKPTSPAVMSAFGIWLHPNTDDHTFQLYRSGEYGTDLSKFLKRQTASFVFLDIGANQGLYAILAGQNPQCAQVFAFEPVPATAAILRKNIALNAATRVTLVQKAISDTAGQITIYTKDQHSGVATLRSDLLDGSQTTTIDAIDADGLSDLIPVSDTPILIKIDVEGHEDVVISQLMKTDFASRIQAIYYECDARWVNLPEIQSHLQDNGFHRFDKIGGGQHYNMLARR